MYVRKRRTASWCYPPMALLAVCLLVGACSKKDAQKKTYEVGILQGLEFFAPSVDGFKEAMTELGYAEGKNISYHLLKAPNHVGNESLLQQFIGDKVDLIFSFPTEASIEAKAAAQGSGIPVVFTNCFIEGNNLVESVARPGGNVTGVRWTGPDNAVKRLELLHKMVPEAKRIWLPYQKGYPTVEPALVEMRPVAKALGLTVIEGGFADMHTLKAHIDALPSSGDVGFDAILQIAEPFAVIPPVLEMIFNLAEKHGLPAGGAKILEAERGSLFSYIPDPFQNGRLAAPLADKIFKGASAGELPVVTPESYLEINYRLIQKLGLNVSDGMLSQASKIFR